MANENSTPFDDANSTSTPLAGDAVWTGGWRLIKEGYSIRISSYADVTGTVFIDYRNSDSGEVITEPGLGYSCGANILEMHIVAPSSSYYRVRYTNDATAQTVFELYSSFVRNLPWKPSPYNKRIGRDEDAIPTRPSDPQDDILRSLRAGVENLNKWGFREDLDSSDGDGMIIADSTTNTPTILTTASTFTVAYDNTTDGLGQSGALSVLITYLDANEALQTGMLTLGSSGSDVTSFSGLGINRCVVLSSGSANANTNDLTITATTGGSVQAFVPGGTSTTQQLWANIPENSIATVKFLLFNAFKTAGGGVPRVTFKFWVYNRGTETTYEVARQLIETDVENTVMLLDPIGFPLSARDVFWVTANTDSNNTQVAARVSMNIYAID